MLVCSSVMLRHITILNVCSVLADATYYHAIELVTSLQGYMARNMETLLESRMLDDFPGYLIKQLAAFVRKKQAEKLPRAGTASFWTNFWSNMAIGLLFKISLNHLSRTIRGPFIDCHRRCLLWHLGRKAESR